MLNSAGAEKINRVYAQKIYWHGVWLMLLVFLAYLRWMPGGDRLTPEEGVRGWVEIGLVTISLLFILVKWGQAPILAGFKLSSFTWLILFCAFALVSSFWSPNFKLSLGKAYGLTLVILLASAIAYQSFRFGISIARILFVSLILLTAFLFIITIIEFHVLVKIDWSLSRPRLSLAYEHPNVSADVFAMTILAGVYLLMRTRITFQWGVNFVLIILLAICLYLTNSRTAIFGTLFSLVLLFSAFFKMNDRASVFLFLLAVVSNILFFLSLLGFLGDFISQNPEWLTLNGRIALWDAVLKNSTILSLFGIGYFSSRYIILDQFAWGINAHNVYLEVFLTTGLIGFLLLIFFYLSTLSLFRNWRSYPLPLILLIYTTIDSLTDVRLFAPGITMFITCILIFHQQFLQQKTVEADS